MQVNKLNTLILFSALLLCQGCFKKHLSPDEYRKWVKDYSNGLHKKKQIGDITFDVQYTPDEMMVLNENPKGISPEILAKRKEELKGMEYFIVRLGVAGNKVDFLKYGVASEKEFYENQYYYSFGFQNDIYLEEENKVIPCKLFHFERSYDLSNSRTFVVAFKNPEGLKDKTLVIDSKSLGLGPVKILFEQKDLKSIPELKI